MRKEKIQEKYDCYVDALVDLYMECYSDVLTEEICNDIKSLEGKQVEVPSELRKNCIAKIKKEFAKNRRAYSMKRIGKSLKVVAALAVVIMALSSVLFVSVEAVRVPIINYYIEKGDTRWTFSGLPKNNMDIPEETINYSDPLAGLISEEYDLISLEDDSNGHLMAVYEDNSGSRIIFTSRPMEDSIDVDVEGAQSVNECRINEHDGLLVIEDEYITVLWADNNLERYFSIVANGLSDEEVAVIAQKIAVIISD